MALEAANKTWPIPAFYFRVLVDEVGELYFREVFGLDMECIIQDDFKKTTVDTGVKSKRRILTLRKGTYKGIDQLFEWFGEMKMNIIKHRKVTISLLDDFDEPTMVWSVYNAWPVRIEGVNIASNNEDSTIDELELQYEEIVIENI